MIIDYPWYFVLLCLLAGAVYAGVLYFVGRRPERRWLRWVLAAVRLLAVGGVAFLLLAPVMRRTVHERQRPRLVLAQDVSLSVRQGKDSAFTLQALVPALEEDFSVSYVPFGTDGSTDIGAVLDRYRADDVAAMVLASDGLHNRGASPASAAGRLTFPVYTVALGDTTPQRDAWLSDLRCNRIALAGNTFPVEVTVAARMLAGRASRLVVSGADGKTRHSQPLDYEGDDYAVTLTLQLPAEGTGLQRYSAYLQPVAGEVSEANNRLTFYVDVIDTRRRVVIFAHAPHPDLGALRRSVESNPNYKAEVVLAADVERGRWQADDDISLAVLHNLPSAAHPSVAFAERWPRLYVVGSQTDLGRFNALHSGLEIVARTQRVNEVTALSNGNFTLFNIDAGDLAALEAMPPLTAPFGQSRLAADVQMLFSARLGNIDSRQPLVAASGQGEQRRAWVWGEGLWRWRMADWQNNQTHEHFDRLVSQLVAFTAMQTSRERLQVDAARSYAEGEPAVVKAVLYNEAYETTTGAEVTLSLKGDSVEADYTFRRDGNGYSLTLPPLAEGLYRYRAAASDGSVAEGSFAVEAMNLERQRTVADHSLLATVAAVSGGQMYGVDQGQALLDALRTIKPTIYSHTRYAELLRLPLVLALLLLLLAIEWVMRKYHGEI